jgi:hypothetical protein
MAGGFLRELAVLVVVFAPLEAVLKREMLTLRALGAIVLVALVSWGIGVYLGVEPND